MTISTSSSSVTKDNYRRNFWRMNELSEWDVMCYISEKISLNFNILDVCQFWRHFYCRRAHSPAFLLFSIKHFHIENCNTWEECHQSVVPSLRRWGRAMKSSSGTSSSPTLWRLEPLDWVSFWWRLSGKFRPFTLQSGQWFLFPGWFSSVDRRMWRKINLLRKKFYKLISTSRIFIISLPMYMSSLSYHIY